MEKLATLYALMTAFQLKLSNEHAIMLFNMINETNLGAVLLKIRKELGITNTDGSASLIFTNDGSMTILFVLTAVEHFGPYVEAMDALGKVLESRGIHLEVDSWENYTTEHGIAPF